jgi:CBS domain-containing protein
MAPAVTLESILAKKGAEVLSLPPAASVYDAIAIMARSSIGALPVLDGEKLIGIISERDYARKVILKGKLSKETAVKEIMTSPVHFVTPDCTVDEAMRVMTEHRIRHLPVLTGDRIVGIVSIGDLVRSLVDQQAATIEQLHNYITGQYPG